MNDDLLLKIHRKYSDNEIVALQDNKIKEQAIEIGQLKSHVAELEDTISSMEAKQTVKIDKEKGWTLLIAETEYISELKASIKALQTQIENASHKDYKKEARIWQERYFSEIAKNSKKE
jgi:hypothetical protein